MKTYYLQKFCKGFPTEITKVVAEDIFKQLITPNKLTVEQLKNCDYWNCYNIEEIK